MTLLPSTHTVTGKSSHSVKYLDPMFVPTRARDPVSSKSSGIADLVIVPSYLSAVTPLYCSVPNGWIFLDASIISLAFSITSY